METASSSNVLYSFPAGKTCMTRKEAIVTPFIAVGSRTPTRCFVEMGLGSGDKRRLFNLDIHSSFHSPINNGSTQRQ